MKNKKAIILLSCLLFIQKIFAQIGVGEWRDHLSFNFATNIVQSSSKIYVASKNGIFSYNKASNNIEKITKVNKLSDIGISQIAYSENNELLFVGYTNGNIDLVYDNDIFNIPDIKREIITGSKSVNHVLFIDEYAYLSCGFGIVIVNLEKKEIKDTYYIGDLGTQVNVNQLVLSGNFLYAATSQGIYMADYTNPNLIDFSNWQRLTSIPDYDSDFTNIYVQNGEIMVNKSNASSNDILYLYKGGTWSIFNNEYPTIRNIKSTSTSIQLVTNRNVLIYDTEFNYVDSLHGNINPFDVIADNSGTYWIADNGGGLVKYAGQVVQVTTPNGPYAENAFSVYADNNRVLVAAGGLSPSWGNIYLNATVYSFQDEQWQSFINYNAPDYVSVILDPENSNHYFACSWGQGLIEYTNNEIVNTYKSANSTLQTAVEGEESFRVAGVVYDNENNLWVTNSLVSSPVSVRKYNGEWQSFNFNEILSNTILGDIIINKYNQKWVILPTGNGLFVFDSGESIDDKNDDSYKKLSIVDENGKLITNDVYSIAEDLDGAIWVGTNQGIVVYYSPEEVFEEGLFYAQRITITVGDATNFLLKSQVISSIAVDGANRKWIGTKNSGIYLVSEDGTEEIYHFTENNSPLFSDKINDIAINHETGEVFIATDKGLLSYRGSATKGNNDFKDVYVYPNPVRENYDGEITIRGLVSEANVKITDIGGNIVYETTAQGGQATWDGNNFSGRRVGTGVYLVFCTNDDGSKTHITKLLFIK